MKFLKAHYSTSAYNLYQSQWVLWSFTPEIRDKCSHYRKMRCNYKTTKISLIHKTIKSSLRYF